MGLAVGETADYLAAFLTRSISRVNSTPDNPDTQPVALSADREKY